MRITSRYSPSGALALHGVGVCFVFIFFSSLPHQAAVLVAHQNGASSSTCDRYPPANPRAGSQLSSLSFINQLLSISFINQLLNLISPNATVTKSGSVAVAGTVTKANSGARSVIV